VRYIKGTLYWGFTVITCLFLFFFGKALVYRLFFKPLSRKEKAQDVLRIISNLGMDAWHIILCFHIGLTSDYDVWRWHELSIKAYIFVMWILYLYELHERLPKQLLIHQLTWFWHYHALYRLELKKKSLVSVVAIIRRAEA